MSVEARPASPFKVSIAGRKEGGQVAAVGFLFDRPGRVAPVVLTGPAPLMVRRARGFLSVAVGETQPVKR